MLRCSLKNVSVVQKPPLKHSCKEIFEKWTTAERLDKRNETWIAKQPFGLPTTEKSIFFSLSVDNETDKTHDLNCFNSNLLF